MKSFQQLCRGSLLPEGQNRVRSVWQSLQGHHGVPQAKQESGKLREWHLQ